MDGLTHLLACIQDISGGTYSNDIMELTSEKYDPFIREVAESVGMMMVRIEAREFALEQANEDLKCNILATVRAIARGLSLRDPYTRGHGERVGSYCERLAKRMGLPEDEVWTVKVAGTLHDIGKIGFSDRLIQNVDTKVDSEMLAEIRQHPEWGFCMLRGLEFLGPALDFVRSHHERLDGTGYPNGLKGDEIVIGARILSVADVFDAITTNRSYQDAVKLEKSFSILRKLAGPSLDPDLVEKFIMEINESGLEDVENNFSTCPMQRCPISEQP
ncbi:HD-GYP domain-containing protein [Maridesulfovibrio hydrothermalis]|uniref:Metal dependent phosphohydrolase n=1 Tax=Maridesulfovibrio hydrothermalis AM13 = DSM 14728 TaxID=1121451 RepID=L0RAZ9_9BACT|nr:HD domain-containing phosphohydrolase [Maridesulfovibrio hydrothermalis]CCO23375.1 Metal dependent phosphohydrolase [Maridesulfovibrio hydrothermalis AM13 = DSM 14728]